VTTRMGLFLKREEGAEGQQTLGTEEKDKFWGERNKTQIKVTTDNHMGRKEDSLREQKNESWTRGPH